MKILVTGGAGFIGHHLVRSLLDDGHEVAIVDNFTNYGIIPRDEMDALHKTRLARIPECTVYRKDIIDLKSMQDVFNKFKPEIVVHCAAYPRAKVLKKNPSVGIPVLTTGLTHLLNCSKQVGIKRFVYVSSSMVYGDIKHIAHEGQACHPEGMYSILKYVGEITSRDFCKNNDIECRVVRPSSVYGPYDINDRIVSKFFETAFEDGKLQVNGDRERLDFTYIDDVVNGLKRITTMNTQTSWQIFNISHGIGRTILEAAELCTALVGKGSIKVNPADVDYPSRASFSTLKALEFFGYSSKIDMETGFKMYYDWLISQRT